VLPLCECGCWIKKTILFVLVCYLKPISPIFNGKRKTIFFLYFLQYRHCMVIQIHVSPHWDIWINSCLGYSIYTAPFIFASAGSNILTVPNNSNVLNKKKQCIFYLLSSHTVSNLHGYLFIHVSHEEYSQTTSAFRKSLYVYARARTLSTLRPLCYHGKSSLSLYIYTYFKWSFGK